ncbi:unnamed protein product [Rodentolepis nana]|uniref:Uncharacterized protein n=1 Tax=Rodentolepis nana TaxID=102285 RepID=A0A0R3THL4_RODNA|nr:unnamed protein product [Rodentolepis nana]
MDGRITHVEEKNWWSGLASIRSYFAPLLQGSASRLPSANAIVRSRSLESVAKPLAEEPNNSNLDPAYSS